MRRNHPRVPAIALALFLQVDCAGREAPTVTAPGAIAIGQDGQVALTHLPAVSADGASVAVAERCDDRRGPPCLAVVILSVDGNVRERIEVARSSASETQVKRVNHLLADGRFAPMTRLELPFSARDLDVMTLRASDVVIHYSGATLLVERDDHLLARLDVPPSSVCTGPWIRSLFLDDKTHTLAVEIEYHDQTGCTAPPPTWRVVRFN